MQIALSVQAKDIALEVLNRWLAQDSESEVANLYQVKILMSQQQFYAAAELLENMSTLGRMEGLNAQSEFYSEVSFLQAMTFIELRKYQEALALLQTLESTKYSSVAIYYTGQIYEALGDQKEALAQYKNVSGKYFFQSNIRIASILAGEKKFEKALSVLSKVTLNSAPEAISKALLEANIYMAVDDDQSAINAINGALEIKPGDLNLLFLRGVAYVGLHKPLLAEQDLNKVLVENENSPEVLNALGYTLTNFSNRYHEAFDVISKALEISPNSPAIMDSYGWVLFKLGKYDEALNFLKKAYDSIPETEIGAHYAVVLNAMGQKKQAEIFIQKMSQSNKLSKNAVYILQQYQLPLR